MSNLVKMKAYISYKYITREKDKRTEYMLESASLHQEREPLIYQMGNNVLALRRVVVFPLLYILESQN